MVVYSSPARSQHGFSPNHSLLGNMVKTSASAPHSVPNILSVLGAGQGAGQARRLKLLQGIAENERVKPKHLLAYACSQHRAMQRAGTYSYVLSSSLCIFPLPPKCSTAVRVSCKQNSLWHNFCFHTRVSSVWLNDKPGSRYNSATGSEVWGCWGKGVCERQWMSIQKANTLGISFSPQHEGAGSGQHQVAETWATQG